MSKSQQIPSLCTIQGHPNVNSRRRSWYNVRCAVTTPAPNMQQDEAKVLSQFSITAYSCARYVHDFLEEPLLSVFPKTRFIEHRLDEYSAKLAEGTDAVILFVNDNGSQETLQVLKDCGVKLIAFRCAGFDRLDLEKAQELGMKIVRVPRYSPTSVAEQAAALLLAVNRNLMNAYSRVLGGNFTLSGLTGFELHGKTVGVIGTGAIGANFCKIMLGFGCRVVAQDLYQNDSLKELGIEYMEKEDVLKQSDVVSLHCPLLPSTYNLINKEALDMMKNHAILINVSRGGLVDTDALIEALKQGQIGGAGLDVYEQEHTLFFQDRSVLNRTDRMKIFDYKFAQLRSFPNVIITPHSAFLTDEALANIAETTIGNLKEFALGQNLTNEVK